MLTQSDAEIYLNNISPYEFEKLIANIWRQKFNYETEVTSGSHDRGIDVIAEQEAPINRKVLIQVKLYNKNNKIGSKEIRQYATLYQQEKDVDQVVIISTGEFTSQAEDLADDLSVELFDRVDTVQWLTDDNLSEDILSLIKNTGSDDILDKSKKKYTSQRGSTSGRSEDKSTSSKSTYSTQTEGDTYNVDKWMNNADFLSEVLKIDDPGVAERQQIRTAYDKLRRARGTVNRQDNKDKITKMMIQLEQKLRESKT